MTTAPDAALALVDAPVPAGGADAPPLTASAFHMVMSSLSIGSSGTEADAFAFDLDGSGTVDDRLNQTLIVLGGFTGLDFETTLAGLLAAGDFVVLDAVHAGSRTDEANAGWQIYVGNPQSQPDLSSGHGEFSIADDSPRDAIVRGTIGAGRFSGGPDTLTIEIGVIPGAPPLHLQLAAGRVEANLTESGCSEGRLGGAIPVARLETDVFPTLAAALTAFLAADPENAFIRQLDKDDDGIITAAELAGSSVVQAFISPDLDLFDADGMPGSDGEPDSLSLALGFTCTNAVFTE